MTFCTAHNEKDLYFKLEFLKTFAKIKIQFLILTAGII